MSKKKLCGPCEYFRETEYFFGLGCVRKGLQLGEMWIQFCGDGNCVYFKPKSEIATNPSKVDEK